MAILLGILAALTFAAAPNSQAAPDDSAAAPNLEHWVRQLGAPAHTDRDDAMRQILRLGPAHAAALGALRDEQADPEVRRRLQYVLENLAPPNRAVLIARADPGSGLRAGDVVTHVNGRRVLSAADFRQRLAAEVAPFGATLRVRGAEGVREIGPAAAAQVAAALDYSAPRGATLAEVVQLYADGLAEQAWETLQQIGGDIPEGELSSQLYGRIAYTAGFGQVALDLLWQRDPECANPISLNQEWESPSRLDLAGPGPAPFHLALSLLAPESRFDPDLRVQRVLIPANRLDDALLRAADLWTSVYRDGLAQEDDEFRRKAGNQLAVCGWMLSDMGLRSECCRLIEPRSQILRYARHSVRKWVRVDTDAWLDFFAGHADQALAGFYEHAMDILQRPTRDDFLLIRNPYVAARVAFFLYQQPHDPRIDEALRAVSLHEHPLLHEYVNWMLFSLNPANEGVIRRHLHDILPNLPDEAALPCARAVALLEYVQPQPDVQILDAARGRILASPAGPERDLWLGVTEALLALVSGDSIQATRALDEHGANWPAALRWTVKFRAAPPAGSETFPALATARLAVPADAEGARWVVIDADRRLLLFEGTGDVGTEGRRDEAGRPVPAPFEPLAPSSLRPLAAPSPTWFPGPQNWPWLGCDERAGRAWAYDRRRLHEVTPDQDNPVRLNIDQDLIQRFDERASSIFDALAACMPRPEGGEDGEFLRDELKANLEYTHDPDLPEIGVLAPLEGAPRFTHIAFRGGPHLIVDGRDQRIWTSNWIQQELRLDAPPALYPEPLNGGEGAPRLALATDQGLMLLDTATQQIERLALPVADAHVPIMPEDTPYARRDPRYYYCATSPDAGGKVFRLRIADNVVEETDLVNEALPASYFRTQTRSAIRAALDAKLRGAQLSDLRTFIAEAAQRVTDWTRTLPNP